MNFDLIQIIGGIRIEMNIKSKNGRRVITYSESVSIGSFCQKALFSFAGDSFLY